MKEIKENKKKTTFKDIFSFHLLIVFLISLILFSFFMIILVLINGGFHLLQFTNATFVTGLVSIGVGGLSIVTNEGLFDSIVVGFSNLGSVFKRNGTKKYDGTYEYQVIKSTKRRSNKFNFIAYIMVGIIYLIIFGILYSILH